MEIIVSQTMQHRKVLFLISLPKTPEFQDCIEDVNECLDELRQFQVDVREHIRREDLADANKYDVIIVVAHHDTASEDLVLADDTLSIKDFVSSLPTDFKGIIDFSSCYSATAFAAIKERCPGCKVQVALDETTLLRRLIIYPTLVECLYNNPTVDYGVAYKEASKAFDDALGGIDETETSNAPMVHLGQKRTSVYAPPEARRKSLVPIYVFLHCDAEKEIVNKKADRNTVVYISSEDLGDFEIGETLTLVLSFIPCDDIEHLHIEGPDRKQITISDDIVKEFFIVRIDNDFHSANFGCYISVYKDSQDIPVRTYPVIINMADDTLQDDVVNDADDEQDEKIVEQLMISQIFKEKKEAKEFVDFCRSNVKPIEITKKVIYLVKQKIIVASNKGRPLWKILHENGLYKPKEANWYKRLV